MILTEPQRYLLDVNVLLALLDMSHAHHDAAIRWFQGFRGSGVQDRQWAICPFAEAGFLRYATRGDLGGLSMAEATALLAHLAEMPGYHYQPIEVGWQTLSAPLFPRLFGHQQVTDAFLLGLAIHAGLVLATFDQAMIHLAGEYRRHVLLLAPK